MQRAYNITRRDYAAQHHQQLRCSEKITGAFQTQLAEGGRRNEKKNKKWEEKQQFSPSTAPLTTPFSRPAIFVKLTKYFVAVELQVRP